jgi:hypothetical protein
MKATKADWIMCQWDLWQFGKLYTAHKIYTEWWLSHPNEWPRDGHSPPFWKMHLNWWRARLWWWWLGVKPKTDWEG